MDYIIEDTRPCYVTWSHKVSIPDDTPERDRARLAQFTWENGGGEAMGEPRVGHELGMAYTDIRIRRLDSVT